MPKKNKTYTQQQYLDLILQEIARTGWDGFCLTDFAQEAKLSLVDIHKYYPTKYDVLDDLRKRIDTATIQELEPPEPHESKKDRLFEVMMGRFDAMTPYKDVLRRLWDDSLTDPMLILSSVPRGLQSVAMLLNLAGIETDGWCNFIKIKIFSAFYLGVMYTWLKDETEDLGPTMATLDRGLEKFKSIPKFF
jgi:AcrR family transcriptional regulator